VRRRAGEAPPRRTPGDERPVLTITGNLGYFVNRDAVHWWLRHVWPELRRRRPEVRLVIAGDRPAAGLRRRILAAGAELVESPPDLRAVLAQATIALAPMRGGAGLPIKILEAWSVGVPVIATPWAAAGTFGRPWEDLLIVDHPGEWLEAVFHLLDDPALRGRLAASALERLLSIHSRDRVREQWLGVVEGVGGAEAAVDASRSLSALEVTNR
jgi:glycosyltransferase involved in cell wall biosynthesis